MTTLMTIGKYVWKATKVAGLAMMTAESLAYSGIMYERTYAAIAKGEAMEIIAHPVKWQLEQMGNDIMKNFGIGLFEEPSEEMVNDIIEIAD